MEGESHTRSQAGVTVSGVRKAWRTARLIEDTEFTMRCHWASPGFLTSLYQTSHLKPLPTSTQPNKWTWTLRDKDLNPSCLGSPPEVGSVLTFCAQWMPPDSNHGRMDHPRAPPGGCCAAALYYDWKVSCWRRECYLLIEIMCMCPYLYVFLQYSKCVHADCESLCAHIQVQGDGLQVVGGRWVNFFNLSGWYDGRVMQPWGLLLVHTED